MSVLIKDENMPESCGNCWLLVSGTDVNGKPEYECVLTEEKRAFEELFSKRGKYCPLVEIPPHGRLIDADELIKNCEKWKESEIQDEHDDVWNRGIDACINEVKHHAPTVIESEEEQENE